MGKDYLKDLKISVLSILVKYAKWSFIKITEIRDKIKADQDFLWDSRVIDDLANSYGILTPITSTINQLRNEGHPILSSNIQGKGYTYAGDWRRNDLDKVWDDKFTANFKRKNIPIVERRTDNKLFNNLIKQITKAVFNGKCEKEVREKLLVVRKKHKLKKEVELKKEKESEEDETQMS